MKKVIDRASRIKGSLIGGAVGDALGDPVEFFNTEMIFSQYGEVGITGYDKGYITDDTQMSLFTANAILEQYQTNKSSTIQDYIKKLYESYLDWYFTQTGEKVGSHEESTLLNEKRLYSRRAPGNACLCALASGQMGSVDRPINDSKGCGGLMRTAPIALFFAGKNIFNRKEIAELSMRAAAITHGHTLGYLPSAVLSEILCNIFEGQKLLSAIQNAISTVEEWFGKMEHFSELKSLLLNAVELAYDEDIFDDLDAIRMLGNGWVAEENLAIAVYCSLRHSDSFREAIIAAVNHDGDSDSTGAVTGNIIGAYLGIERISHKYLENLELYDVLVDISDRMK